MPESTFDRRPPLEQIVSSIEFVGELETIIQQRLQAADDESYTARLAAEGTKRIAQKLGEEAVELALASVDGDRNEAINEAADLVYHLLVLLNVQGIKLLDVANELARRHRAASGRDRG